MPRERRGKAEKQSRPSSDAWQSQEEEIKEDLDYMSCGGWRPTVEDLIHLLRSFRRFESADLLERQMRCTANGPSLDEEEPALSRIQTELATLTRQSNPDLSGNQKEELRRLVWEAIRLTTMRHKAIPEQREEKARAVRFITRWMKEHPSAFAPDAPTAGKACADAASKDEQRDLTIYGDGNGSYRVGASQFICVNANEDSILQAFSDCHTMDTKKLKEKSRIRDADPARVLRGLRQKYGGRFADAIRPAGKKGQGGYHAVVKFLDSAS